MQSFLCVTLFATFDHCDKPCSNNNLVLIWVGVCLNLYCGIKSFIVSTYNGTSAYSLSSKNKYPIYLPRKFSKLCFFPTDDSFAECPMFGDPALELVVNRRVPAAPCQRRSLARPDSRPRDRVQVDGVDTATGLGETSVLKHENKNCVTIFKTNLICKKTHCYQH